MVGSLRYDEIQQRSIHNAYAKQEQLVDQLVAHRARDIELDVHRWSQRGCADTPPPDWGIYHTIGEAGANVCKVSEALRQLRSFHRANPTHEVVTVHLELKSRNTGELVGVFDDHSRDELDATILAILGRARVFTPADLLSVNPGAVTLLAAVARGPSSRGGWPTTQQLRGRFIVVVHGEAEIDTYATAADATSRVCFLMRESLWSDVDAVLRHPDVVFHGEVDPARAPDLRRAVPGLVLRSTQADDPDSFRSAQLSGVNLVLTDRVDVHADSFARTHNDRRYPFARAGLAGSQAWRDPTVRDLSEHEQLYVLTTHSGDIGGIADSLTFARSASFPPSAAVGSPAEDTWSALLASASNTTIDSLGACFLMARASLDPDAPFVAVGRAADSHGVVVRWRDGRGAEASQVELGDLPVSLGGVASHADRENVPWVRLRLTPTTSTSVRAVCEASADGLVWRAALTREMPSPLELRGIAACGHWSHHLGAAGVEFFVQCLRRNGHLPVEFTTQGIGTADVSVLELVGERPRNRGVGVTLVQRADSDVVLSSEQRRGESPLCHADERDFTWAEVAVVTTATYRAEPRDYDAAVVTWSVGGSTLPAAPRGAFTVPVAGRAVSLRYAIDAATRSLVLITDSDDGTFTVNVVARAAEADGASPTSSPPVTLSVEGRRSGFTHEYAEYLHDCIAALTHDALHAPTPIVDPRPPVSAVGPDLRNRTPLELSAALSGVRLAHAADAAALRELASRLRGAAGPS